MSITETLRGTLRPDGTLELDNPPMLPAGPVEIVLRPLAPAPPPGEDWWQYLQRVRSEAEAAGGHFLAEEEIESQREDFRSGDDRVEQIYRGIEQRQKGKSGP